ncbi:glycerophosphodiester phosphodiesterase family protein [Erythrobacter aureus]|nr:glycerophosphodiester phosphodiesterase family protein [Erythrobacter aureus]
MISRGKFCLALLAFALGGCASLTSPPEEIQQVQILRDKLFDPRGEVLVVAHRGCWENAPENSIKALDDCIELGVPVVEVDVRRTADGVLVAMHDESIDRTTTGSGRVSELRYGEIALFHLKEGAGGSLSTSTDQRVPKLEEILLRASGRVLINIDAKAEIYDDIIRELRSLDLLDHAILKAEVDLSNVSSFYESRLFDDVIFMPKFTEGDQSLSDFALAIERFRPVAVELKFSSESFIREGAVDLAEMGTRIWVNTLSESPEKSAGHTDALALRDPDGHWGHLITLGASIIQTDHPRVLLEFLSSNRLISISGRPQHLSGTQFACARSPRVLQGDDRRTGLRAGCPSFLAATGSGAGVGISENCIGVCGSSSPIMPGDVK